MHSLIDTRVHIIPLKPLWMGTSWRSGIFPKIFLRCIETLRSEEWAESIWHFRLFFTFCVSVQTFSVKDAWEFLWENSSRKMRQTFCLFPFCVLLRELQNVLQVTLHWALSAGAKIFYTVKKEQKSKQCLQWYHLQHNRKPSNIGDFATDNT